MSIDPLRAINAGGGALSTAVSTANLYTTLSHLEKNPTVEIYLQRQLQEAQSDAFTLKNEAGSLARKLAKNPHPSGYIQKLPIQPIFGAGEIIHPSNAQLRDKIAQTERKLASAERHVQKTRTELHALSNKQRMAVRFEGSTAALSLFGVAAESYLAVSAFRSGGRVGGALHTGAAAGNLALASIAMTGRCTKLAPVAMTVSLLSSIGGLAFDSGRIHQSM
jgi:hypothetical protein